MPAMILPTSNLIFLKSNWSVAENEASRYVMYDPLAVQYLFATRKVVHTCFWLRHF